MQTNAADREDLGRPTSDGRTTPSTGDTATHDLADLWRDLQSRFVGKFGVQRWNTMRADLEDLAGLAIAAE